jgi:Polyketide cyclase / dehydrase and lipid transport
MKTKYFIEKTMAMNATPLTVFNIFIDLAHWNKWTPTIKEISILNNGSAAPGAKIKVLQPKLPPAIWTITEIDHNKSLTWEKKSFGLNMRSEHQIIDDAKAARVTIRITYEGTLAGLFYRLTHSLTDRYMGLEINGLKSAAEKVQLGEGSSAV